MHGRSFATATALSCDLPAVGSSSSSWRKREKGEADYPFSSSILEKFRGKIADVAIAKPRGIANFNDTITPEEDLLLKGSSHKVNDNLNYNYNQLIQFGI